MKKGKEFYVIFDCSHETAAEILKQVRGGGRKRKAGVEVGWILRTELRVPVAETLTSPAYCSLSRARQFG